MELIKTLVKQFYPIMIMFACVSFVVYMFFSAELNGGNGVFEGTGNVYVSMIGTDEVTNNGLNYAGNTADSYVPSIKYNSGAKAVGDCLSFKSLFDVQKEDGTIANGSTEDTFALYLMDIKNQTGNSVLEILSSEEIAQMEEIPAPFVYDKEQDLLYLHGSGVYTVYIKIYGSGGGMEIYEFQLPVEI